MGCMVFKYVKELRTGILLEDTILNSYSSIGIGDGDTQTINYVLTKLQRNELTQ
jgi:hypothetical protein